jgi:hypothetical protein
MIRREALIRYRPVLSACLLACLVGSQLGAGEENIVTLKGAIEVAAYDDDGAVEAVAVYDSDWGEVLVSNEGKGKELLDHVGAFAEITGTIVEIDEDSHGFEYEIIVTTYTIEGSEDLENDEDWDPENPE